jgi:hypothetical protein
LLKRANNFKVSLFYLGAKTGAMRRYYFDLRVGDDLAPDDEGLELPSIERVQEEAARSLADMARDAVRTDCNGTGHRMAIEVRDDDGPVLQVKFTFQIDRHEH